MYVAETWPRSRLTAAGVKVFMKNVRKPGIKRIINDNDATIEENIVPG
jgi:hypothetical protein